MNLQGPIVITHCSAGDVTRVFHTSLSRLYEFDKKNRNLIQAEISVDGSFIEDNRNTLTKTFLASSAQWMLTIDTDISFEPEAVYGLFDDADPDKRPFVSGLYFTYVQHVYMPPWFHQRPDGRFVSLSEVRPELQQIAGCGMGFALIHRGVFEAVLARSGDAGSKYAGPQPSPRNDTPWFDRLVIDDGEKYEHVGEDLSFCARVAACGIPIYGEGRICVNHHKRRAENVTTLMERINAAQWREAHPANGAKAENPA